MTEWSVRGPNKKNTGILNAAMEYIKKTPYRVTMRFVFYKLLQAGILKTKEDYNHFKSITATARKNFWEKWNPWTFYDDTRRTIEKVEGFEDIDDCLDNLHSMLSRTALYLIQLDHFYEQEFYVELFFEAGGMVGQFEYYTDAINLVPFRGDPSINFKWRIAKRLEEMAKKYDKPIKILYFGDYDPKGIQIPQSAEETIQSWCRTDIEFIRCGLNLDQIKKYNIPAKPESPEKFEWEGLTDEQAEELILDSIDQYLNRDLIDSKVVDSENLQSKWGDKISEAIKKGIDEIER